MEQVVLADKDGNITVSPKEARTVVLPTVESGDSDSSDNYWDWVEEKYPGQTGRVGFNIKMQAAGVLNVLLVGENLGEEKLIPFHEGWNPERVWRIYAHDSNDDGDGIIIAGR